MDVNQSDIETKPNPTDALASIIVSNNNKFGTNSAAINTAVAASVTGAAATMSAILKEDCKEQLLLLTSSTAVVGATGLAAVNAASGTSLIATPIGSNALTTLPGANTMATTISSAASGSCSSINVTSSSSGGCVNIKSEPSDRLQQSLITPTQLNTATTTTVSKTDDQMCNVSKSTNLLNSNSSSGISGTMNNNNILCNTQNAIGSDSSNTKNESVAIKEEIDRDSPSPMMPPHAASKHLVS